MLAHKPVHAQPLAEVPPLVFSEAMRDVDLFIGVTSISADPEWLDRGEGRRFEEYWHRWGFGARVLGLILSKAFLLAADAKITDESITRQIGRGRGQLD
jgi:hypothetical protein